jgi:hypothetical protein
MPKATSRKQAALFGAVAGGKSRKATGLTQREAKKRLRGVDVKRLPTKAKRKR